MATVRKGIDWGAASPQISQREEITFVLGDKIHFRHFVRVLLSLLVPTYVLFRALFGPTESRPEAAVIVAAILSYVFLGNVAGKSKSTLSSAWDWFLAFFAVVIAAYIFWSGGVFGIRTEYFTTEIFGQTIAIDGVAGTAMLLMVLEANRRTLGWVLVIFIGVFIAYIPLRPYLPGILGGTSIPWESYVLQMFSENFGIYGDGTAIMMTAVFIFLMFGAVMLESRVGSFFTSLANGWVGHQYGGAAKVTVVASGMLGTVNSSGLAEVCTTGPITIPMMKASGFKPWDAAAIETVASTGGSWTPPIMAAAAYFMAQYLNIPYGKICLYAAPPAILFYVAVFVGVHCKAKKEGLRGLNKADLPSPIRVLKEGGYLLLPVVAMIALLIMDYSISRVGLVAIAGVLILSFFKKVTRLGPMNILSAFAETTHSTVIVSTTMILTGVLTAVVDVTGLGLQISMAMEHLAGGSLVVGLLISGAIAFVLGMPLPPLIVYIYGVVFMIPALVDLGANPVAAHLFFLYWGVLGTITPPVCTTSFAAAAIAGAPMMKTGWTATKMAYVAYLLPFLFVFNPALILQNVSWGDILPLLMAFVGVCILAAGIEGYFFGQRSTAEKAVILIIGACLILGLIWYAVGYAALGMLVLTVLALRWRQARRSNV
jgi:TRAP transporter 4TM/12TM fusion protein